MATSIKFVDEGTVYGGEDRAGDESSSDSESGEEESDERKKKATEKKKMKQTTRSLVLANRLDSTSQMIKA